jgi:hypothetical protein
LNAASKDVVKAYASCLGGGGDGDGDDNHDMTKAKRLRELLKSLDAFVQSASLPDVLSELSSNSSSNLRGLLEERKAGCDSPVVKKMCDRILAKLVPSK